MEKWFQESMGGMKVEKQIGEKKMEIFARK